MVGSLRHFVPSLIFARTEIHTLSSTKDIGPRARARAINAVVDVFTHPCVDDLWETTDTNGDLRNTSIVDLDEETSGLHPVLKLDSGITVHGF
jgi:hypothetical protein